MILHLFIVLTETAQSIDDILYSKSSDVYTTYVQSIAANHPSLGTEITAS